MVPHSKHTLEGWSDCLRLDLKEHGIDVVIIEPGVIRTGFEEVMLAPMIARSGSGPYGSHTQSGAGYGEELSQAHPPDVVVRLVMKAVHARRPRTRYAGGHLAKPVMFLRKWFGDRLFDRAIHASLTKERRVDECINAVCSPRSPLPEVPCRVLTWPVSHYIHVSFTRWRAPSVPPGCPFRSRMIVLPWPPLLPHGR